MKKIILCMCVMIAYAVCISCSGGKPIEKVVPISNVEITGNGTDFISINGDVKLYTVQDPDDKKNWSIRATIPMGNIRVLNGDISITSGLNLLDKNYSQVDDDYGLLIQDKELFASMLKSDAGTEKMIAFIPAWESISYHEYKKIADFMERTENIALYIEVESDQYNKQSAISENTERHVSKTSFGNNWDSVLNEYENFVDQYIKLYKKAMDGDMDALAEYTSYLEKINALADNLDAAEGTMTTTQMNRYFKITEKMTNAILEE